MVARSKQSKTELIRIVENAINEECRLPKDGLFLTVDNLTTDNGKPLSHIHAYATLNFTQSDNPLCCSEPGCHLGCGDEWNDAIAENIRMSLRLQQSIRFDIDISSEVHANVTFKQHG